VEPPDGMADAFETVDAAARDGGLVDGSAIDGPPIPDGATPADGPVPPDAMGLGGCLQDWCWSNAAWAAPLGELWVTSWSGVLYHPAP
jgi:hypothetical protein